jgi:isopenicillin-N N-acyltransferase-like protein
MALYERLFAYFAGWSWTEAAEHARLYEPAIGNLFPHLLEEMAGLAHGAGVSYGDILALNARTEVRNAALARAAQECTAFVALPEATQGGRSLIGQNWDWYPDTLETLVVLEAEVAGGPSFVTVVEAGLLAKCGFNGAGLGLATNALVTDLDSGQAGLPYHVLLRAILDCERVEQAQALLVEGPRASAANYLVAQAAGPAIDVEAGPGGPGQALLAYPTRGMYSHTNHYRSPALPFNDVNLARGTGTCLRADRMDELLAQMAGRVTVEGLQRALADHQDRPDSICCHPDYSLPFAEQFVSAASVIMELETRTLWLADGSPCERSYRKLDYEWLLGR